MADPKGRVLTGARCRLSFRGVVAGYMTGFDENEQLTRERLKVLNNIRTKEHVPTDYDTSFSGVMARLVGTTLKSMGLWPKNGSSDEEFLLNILNMEEMTILVEDPLTNLPVRTLEQGFLNARRASIQPTGIVYESIEGVAIINRDESEA